jgi:hypothetical protein
LLIPYSRLLFSLPLPKLSLSLSLLPLLPPLHLLPFPPSSSYQMGAHIPLPASVQDLKNLRVLLALLLPTQIKPPDC